MAQIGYNPHQVANPDEIYQDGEYIIFKPLGLDIFWGADSRYWHIDKWMAELQQVSWLEVSGSVTVDPGKQYSVGFVLSMRPDAFGWGGGTPVYVMAKVGRRGIFQKKVVNIANPLNVNTTMPFNIPGVEEGPLILDVPFGIPDTEIYFGLYEVWSGKWKGGLRIYSAFVREVPMLSNNINDFEAPYQNPNPSYLNPGFPSRNPNNPYRNY